MSAEKKTPVLIAYDGSDFAKAAVRKAADQLEGGRDAIVLTVSEPLEKVPFAGVAGFAVNADTMSDLLASARKGAEEVAAEGCDLAREAGLDAEPVVTVGAPVWDQIVEVAEQRDVDLIVIGSRGLSGLRHVALGSVAAAVAQHSRRSVLIVHAD